MSKVNLSELLKQDIEDLKGLLNYEKYDLTEDHLTEFVQDS